MNWTRVAMTVGLACAAASLLLRGRRARAAAADDGLDPFPSVDPGLPVRMRAMTVGPAASGAGAGSGASGTSSDSPNDAERLQARGIAETPRDAIDGGLFGSNSQQGAEPKVPGLPDFARGA